MNFKKSFFSFLFIFPAFQVIGQSYFQQEVNYKIAVRLDDVRHELFATEQIDYINNSPDTLGEIYFHLWPNAYKNNETALVKQQLENGNAGLYFAPPSDRGFIDSLSFTVNQEKVNLEYDSVNIDIARIILNQPLFPGKSVQIQTPFHVKLPHAKFSRLGHLGQSYMITQWYPKPAVYDRYGWHPIPYLDEGEFYSEFGSFEVHITVPKNYVVAATGELQNQDELEWLDKKAEVTKQIAVFSHDMTFPKSEVELKTLIFKQKKVHDFAWFADKRYHVLKGSVEMPHTKVRITTWAMFTNNEADLWMKSIEYINHALYDYSLWNGDYPYRYCTAVDGTIAAGLGMEYPNVTVIGKSRNASALEDVIVHEVGHNWFYGILGSNERDHAWMDEGINSFNEIRYNYTRYPDKSSAGQIQFGFFQKLIGMDNYNLKDIFFVVYDIASSHHTDQPIELTSPVFTGFNYGIIVYSKTAIVFEYLKSYLGDSLFDACMQKYFEEWKFKHPYPDDIRNVFEKTSGKKLDWFFNDLIKTTGKIDYSITGITSLKGENLINTSSQSYILKIRNKGDVVSPFSISAIKRGQSISTRWIDGFKDADTIAISCNNCEAFRIDADESIPELIRFNNTIRTKGIFKKIEPLSLRFFGGVKDAEKTQLFFIPTLGWNKYNETMLGLAFYNKFFPVKPFEFLIMPMYSFGTKNIAGSADAALTFYPDGMFQNISLSGSIKHYTYNKWEIEGADDVNFNFTRISPSINFEFRKSAPRSSIRKSLKLESIHLLTDEPEYIILSADNKKVQYNNYNRITFNFISNTTLDPYQFIVVAEQGKDFLRSSFELNYYFNYRSSRKGIDFRFFFGGFLKNDQPGRYDWRLSGISGLASGAYQDYTFDEVFFGRSEYDGWTSHQFYEKDGAFKVYAPFHSDKWLSSVNVKIDLPFPFPVRLFADAGTYYNAKNAFPGSQSLIYDGGVSAFLIRNVLEVYFPLFVSSDIKQYNDLNEISWKDRIRFVINFNALNPFEVRKSFINK